MLNIRNLLIASRLYIIQYVIGWLSKPYTAKYYVLQSLLLTQFGGYVHSVNPITLNTPDIDKLIT